MGIYRVAAPQMRPQQYTCSISHHYKGLILPSTPIAAVKAGKWLGTIMMKRMAMCNERQKTN